MRLQVHIRDHIFHYMHAIWAHTHPDNRFFELYDDMVPFHTPDPAGYTLQPGQPSPLGDLPGIDEDGVDLLAAVARSSARAASAPFRSPPRRAAS